jgi:hypothetical protein
MPDESREFLTGMALIALAIESSKERMAGDMSVLSNIVKRLDPHDRMRLAYHSNHDVELRSRYDMAHSAVALADACIEALQEDPCLSRSGPSSSA